MSKLDELLKSTGANIDASMGAGRTARPLHGATTGRPRPRRRDAGARPEQGRGRYPRRSDRPGPRTTREEFDAGAWSGSRNR